MIERKKEVDAQSILNEFMSVVEKSHKTGILEVHLKELVRQSYQVFDKIRDTGEDPYASLLLDIAPDS
jgi:hypothetical protein